MKRVPDACMSNTHTLEALPVDSRDFLDDFDEGGACCKEMGFVSIVHTEPPYLAQISSVVEAQHDP
jgi:hypothetical protein